MSKRGGNLFYRYEFFKNKKGHKIPLSLTFYKSSAPCLSKILSLKKLQSTTYDIFLFNNMTGNTIEVYLPGLWAFGNCVHSPRILLFIGNCVHPKECELTPTIIGINFVQYLLPYGSLDHLTRLKSPYGLSKLFQCLHTDHTNRKFKQIY